MDIKFAEMFPNWTQAYTTLPVEGKTHEEIFRNLAHIVLGHSTHIQTPTFVAAAMTVVEMLLEKTTLLYNPFYSPAKGLMSDEGITVIRDTLEAATTSADLIGLAAQVERFVTKTTSKSLPAVIMNMSVANTRIDIKIWGNPDLDHGVDMMQVMLDQMRTTTPTSGDEEKSYYHLVCSMTSMAASLLKSGSDVVKVQITGLMEAALTELLNHSHLIQAYVKDDSYQSYSKARQVHFATP